MTTTEIPLINKLESGFPSLDNTGNNVLTKKAATVQVIIYGKVICMFNQIDL